jgi:hypothetical protein
MHRGADKSRVFLDSKDFNVFANVEQVRSHLAL